MEDGHLVFMNVLLRKGKIMTTKNVLGLTLTVFFVFLTASTAWSQVDDPKLGVDVDMTFVSKYMWRGYDIFDDHGAFHPSVDFDLYQTGFNLNFWGAVPFGGGNDDLNELDYTLGYSRTFFDDETYAMEFMTQYIYYFQFY